MRKLSMRLGAFLTVFGMLFTPLSTVHATSSGGPQLVSLGQNNAIPNGIGVESVFGVTENGRYMPFTSYATNLVATSTSGNSQAYVRDLASGTTTLVSVSNSGQVANDNASPGKVNANGRYVYFQTTASNMGTNISGNQCYLRDLSADTTTTINPFNRQDGTACLDMSADANLVAINISGTSSVPGIGCPQFPCNWDGDAYLYNRTTGSITPVAIDNNGGYGVEQTYGVWNSYRVYTVSISDDNDTVVFTSPDNLFTHQYNAGRFAYVRNLTTGSLQQLQSPDGRPILSNDTPLLSGNGRYVTYTTHTPDQPVSAYRLYVHDLQTGSDTRVDVAPNGSPANGDTQDHSISSDGKYIAFRSQATNLTTAGSSSGDHVFVRDMVSGTTFQTDVNAQGDQANAGSWQPYVADDGSVFFGSNASNLVATSAPTPQVYMAPPPVVAPVLVQAINAGGSATGSYSADTDFSGGQGYISNAAVDTSNVTAMPAPQGVYQSVRYGNAMTYTLPGLTPNAAYTLRLHFNESYWGTNGNGGDGSRVFNVGVNGVPALSNLDVYQTAGGANKAIVKELPVTADANGNVAVDFTSVTDNAMVSGVELYQGTLPAEPPAPTPPTITSAHINAGGAATGSFVADTNYSGGQTYTSGTSVDTSNASNPAPEAVYRSVRYGNFTYAEPNLTPNTNYLVRLHFNEPYWTTAGSRTFNVSINGTQVLSNLDVYQAAGGANKALAEDFVVASDSHGTITINFTGVTDNAMVSGIEIEQPTVPTPTYYTGNDGTNFSRSGSGTGSGVATQTRNADGSISLSINSASGYADTGFTVYRGKLGDLPNLTVAGTGSPFGLNLWFDANNDGSFFQWDTNGVLTSLGGDTYGLSSGSSNGSLSVNGSSSFFMMDNGQSYTLAQLANGADTASGVTADTIVTVWIGVDVNSGSASTTITSIDGL